MTTTNPRSLGGRTRRHALPRAARGHLAFGVRRRRTATRLPALPRRHARLRARLRRARASASTARRSGSPSAIRSSPARLHDNATARDLAAQLPLTLTFRDHNNVEKTAPLPRELSLDGAPEGHDPAAGDIGYWAPDGDLVFYYDSDAPFFNGIVRIGEFDGEMDAIERQSENFSVTMKRIEGAE